jgi:putative oxidoreductase
VVGKSGCAKACRLKMIQNKLLILTFRFVIGAVFIWSGIIKILDPLLFAQDVANYQSFPQSLSFLIALILPWIEILCGLMLVLGIWSRAAALMISGLLVAFLFLLVVTIIRGIDVTCGCFGALSHTVDYRLILLDSFLLFLSLNIYFYNRPKQI